MRSWCYFYLLYSYLGNMCGAVLLYISSQLMLVYWNKPCGVFISGKLGKATKSTLFSLFFEELIVTYLWAHPWIWSLKKSEVVSAVRKIKAWAVWRAEKTLYIHSLRIFSVGIVQQGWCGILTQSFCTPTPSRFLRNLAGMVVAQSRNDRKQLWIRFPILPWTGNQMFSLAKRWD